MDVAKEDFVAMLVGADQEAVVTFGWRHPQETREVLERLVGLGEGWRLEAVLEPSGTYGDALVWRFRQAGIGVYRVSPKRVHDAAEIYDGLPSLHDAKAAYCLGGCTLEGMQSGVGGAWGSASGGDGGVDAVAGEQRASAKRQ